MRDSIELAATSLFRITERMTAMVYDIWNQDTGEKVADGFNKPFAMAVLSEHGFGEQQAAELLKDAGGDPEHALIRGGMTVLAREVE